MSTGSRDLAGGRPGAGAGAVGIGIGPTAVAAITDYMFRDPEMIRYSLAAVGGSARALAFIFVLVGLKAYRDLLLERERPGE